MSEHASLFPFRDPPRYPKRNGYKIGECGQQPLRDLETWLEGGAFHPYAERVSGTLTGDALAEYLDACRDCPASLSIEGKLDHRGRLTWWLWYRRAGGDPDEIGGCGGYGSAEDAAYVALHHIEEYERHQYEENLLVGIA